MEPVTLPLKRTPSSTALVPMLLMVLGNGLLGVGLPLLWFRSAGAVSDGVALVVAAFAVFVAVSFLLYRFILPKPTPLVIDGESVSFPWERRQVKVDLAEVVAVRGESRRFVLVAAGKVGEAARGDRGVFVVSSRCFKDDDGVARAVAAVRAAIAARAAGEGAEHVARLDASDARERAFHAQRPAVTMLVAGLCVALYGVETSTGALSSVSRMVLLGANVSVLVRDGEVWRLVTACLLHASLIHIFLNLQGFLSLGGLLERWLGRAAYAVVVVGTGVFAHGCSALIARHPLSVGLSGTVFGLLGVLAWSSFRFRKALGGPRLPVSTWVCLLLPNLGLSLLPFVDVVAHAGGFVAGVALAEAFAPRPGLPPRVAGRARAVVCAVVVVAAVCALVRAWARFVV